MKRTKILLFSLMAMTVFYAQGQKEANNWFFGDKAGLTWNTTQDLTLTGLFGTQDEELKGLPTFLSGSPMVIQEGCFTFSDSKGQLLFYSNGINIWNRKNVIMPNGAGLTGHDSSAQSGIIMPYPETQDKYIAVTLNINQTDQLAYSIIDMTLEDGYGDVVSGQKNIYFVNHSGKTGESVTSIRHANGKDIWVVAPGKGSPSYLNAWLVTKSGVSTTPVVTQLPVDVTCTSANGYIKFTPDGKKFAWATHCSTTIFFGEFDALTGQFSNIKTRTGNSNYGIEFSPSGKYLYVGGATSSCLYAFDFEELIGSSTPNNVAMKTFGSFPTAFYSLQLAPDGRIYSTGYMKNYMYVLDNPEDLDHLKIYQTPDGFLSGVGRVGLPSFAANWFAVSIEADQIFCVNTQQDFTVVLSQSGQDEIAYTEWDFGDGSAFVKDTNVGSGSQTHSYTYTKPGMYTITVCSYLANGKEAASNSLVVKVNPCVIPVNPNVHLFD
ncbi:PKD domain-containing protein [Parabacteroides sp. PF5-9]|uniref:PKD domain-containing protein n=1 Tax=Parabacteroides sp. PF5-9 TaxID=1742404 RepID=UPI002476E1F2|nr:PKD domain-containing protein [Parabacteroides sp. PF5-9]MDH6356499.1 WD40 repeat protein [Parabacteroides sp. PF5-9]